uniref:Transcription factor E2F3 n=1 Tax=Haemonchus contortus TaxID=6289 RepID=W6NAE2_HAECO
MEARSNDGDAILLEKLRLDCENLLCKEIELDSTLLDLTSAVKLVREDPTYKPYGYLHLEDVHSLDMFSNQTLIAVKSSAETQSFIEVADPARTGKFQLKVGTANYSPLNVFLCPSYAHVFSSIEEVLSSVNVNACV